LTPGWYAGHTQSPEKRMGWDLAAFCPPARTHRAMLCTLSVPLAGWRSRKVVVPVTCQEAGGT
jgi:hypothetical protein